MRLTLLLAAALAAAPATAYAQASSDGEAVRRAVLDYVDGFYEGDTAKLVRALLPTMNKYGYWKEQNQSAYRGEPMSFQQAIDYAKRVKARNRQPAPTAPKEVVIYDVQDQTASAKLTAWWGTDYLLLGKYDGQWKIVQVLWQSPPPRS